MLRLECVADTIRNNIKERRHLRHDYLWLPQRSCRQPRLLSYSIEFTVIDVRIKLFVEISVPETTTGIRATPRNTKTFDVLCCGFVNMS